MKSKPKKDKWSSKQVNLFDEPQRLRVTKQNRKDGRR